MAPLLSLTDVSKRFGETTAVDALSLEIVPGEIHAILGENGAGKSTLMKIIFGVLTPDSGRMAWKGQGISLSSPSDAQALGIGMVFQHFSLFETLTVTENVILSTGLSRTEVAKRFAEIADRFDLDVPGGAMVHGLSMGERQRVEIVRALMVRPELIIMDEPTSVLPPTAVPGLFDMVRNLAENGCAVLFISHKLSEIRMLCHKATVIRRGRHVATVDPTVESEESLAETMVGRRIGTLTHTAGSVSNAPILKAEALCVSNPDPFGVSLKAVSLAVHGGEIVGVAGISGNGQSLLAGVLAGEQQMSGTDRGIIEIDGHDVTSLGTATRRERGLCYVPEDRNGRGAVAELSLSENALLTGWRAGLVRRGLVDRAATRRFADAVIGRMDVRCTGPDAEARALSGGNLQKFIVGRELDLAPRVIVAAQPTWGVDVGSAQAIMERLRDVREAGAACLLISDELDELLGTCDRIYVAFRGRLSASIPRSEFSETAIGVLMAGRESEGRLA